MSLLPFPSFLLVQCFVQKGRKAPSPCTWLPWLCEVGCCHHVVCVHIFNSLDVPYTPLAQERPICNPSAESWVLGSYIPSSLNCSTFLEHFPANSPMKSPLQRPPCAPQQMWIAISERRSYLPWSITFRTNSKMLQPQAVWKSRLHGGRFGWYHLRRCGGDPEGEEDHEVSTICFSIQLFFTIRSF